MTTLQEPPTTTSPPPPIVPPRAPEVDDPSRDVPRAISTRTVDDRAALVGSGFASLAFVWVVYENILAFSGIVGFVMCWWLVYLAFYAGVSALANPLPVVVDRVAGGIVTTGAAIVGGVLAWVIVYVFIKGFPAYRHLNFFTQNMAGVRQTDPLTKGGIWFAIVGSAEQVAIATVIALPLGIGTAIYLSEVGGSVAKVVRTVVEAMTALPDILAGLFIYTLLIIGLHWSKNGIAVGLALAVTMTPIVARSAEVVLRVVPGGLREASLALGASVWQTIWRVVLPTARSGLATSVILGIARVAGESAPLLIVSGYTTFWNSNPIDSQPQNSLPLFIITNIRSPEKTAITRGYGAAAVLLTLVLILFVAARLAARDRVGSGGRRSRRPAVRTAAPPSAGSAPLAPPAAPPPYVPQPATAPVQTYLYGPDPEPTDQPTD